MEADTFGLLKVTIDHQNAKTMLALTGVTGHLGQNTLKALLRHVAPTDIVAIMRDPQKAASMGEQGVQVRQGDYNDLPSLLVAFEGVTTLLLISTNELDDALRTRQHKNAIDAARQAGVRHVVYTSVVNPSLLSEFGGSASHLATEEYLQASGLTYTIFRNTLYLDLVPGFIGAQALSSGKLYSAVGGGRVSYALREEIAEALANVLRGGNHANQTYDIAPAPTYSMQDVAATLSEVARQPVEVVPITIDQLQAGMRQQGLPEPVVGLMAGITSAMRDNELNLTSERFKQLLGREPTDLKTYLTAIYSLSVATP